MFFPIPPKASWDGYEQISPADLNSNANLALQTLNEVAQYRYRRANTTIQGNSAVLPSVTGMPYIVERITFYGTYSGQPVFNYGGKTFTLPPNGFDAQFYTGTVLPAFEIVGTDNSNNYEMFFTGGITDFMNISIATRTDRFQGITLPNIRSVPLYQDEDILEASAFLAIRNDLQNYADLIVANDSAKVLNLAHFSNVPVSTSQTERIPGTGTVSLHRAVGVIKMNGTGSAGSVVNLTYFINNLAHFNSLPAAGLSTVYFSYDPGTPVSMSQNPTIPVDDIRFQISTTSTGGIKTADIYTITSRI